MNSRNNSEEQNVEHFANVSVTNIIIIVLMVLLVTGGLIYYLKFHKPSAAIKYLTSSTSPGFDLTYTPNL
jgi:hypothetical protein